MAELTPSALVAVPPAVRARLFPDGGARLARLLRVTYAPELPENPCDAEVLVTSWGVPQLTAARLDRLPRLRLIAHIGASVKPFVTGEVFARGIAVTQAGAAMARPVAEVALAFTLALLHRVHRYDHALRSAVPWAEAEQAPPRHEIAGTPIGVVGASRTGRAYLELVRLLGAEVAVYDPFLDDEEAARLGVTSTDLDTLLAGSRIVALHAPSLPGTRHLIGARELARLPDGAGLVNTARSWLVDEAALLTELRTGRIDAALDVYDAEPLPVAHPLRSLPNVLLTPHQAAGTVEGRVRQGDIVADEIARHVAGEPLMHAVGPQDLARMG
ncbi:hydroxyacid dehydrogenase [Amycolatopsis samaneae]|uniref:Hydroxyacid dehydrogenase n=1 Tax=Amycolatopsis samaneae TaxID=664691 RepID=A0ABW5GMS2_9PSEU